MKHIAYQLGTVSGFNLTLRAVAPAAYWVAAIRFGATVSTFITLLFMAHKPEQPENLVARSIRDQLGEGGLERLIEAQEAVQKIFREQSEPVTGSIQSSLQPMQTSFGLRVTASYKFTAEVVPAMQSASPELADKLRLSDPQDAMLLLNLFMALMQVVQTLLTVYQVTHSEPPTQTQIVEIFNNTTNYVINMPHQSS